MSSLIVILAASGLLAANPATVTRSAQAVPAAKVAMAQVAPAKLPVGCFAPVKNGKLASIATAKKIKAACTNTALMQGAGGLTGSVATNIAANVAISTAVAVAANEALKPSNQACVTGTTISPC
jgi:hypothetical protein